MAKFILAAGFAASVLATPLEERWINCQAVSGIVNIMHAQNVATPFCSSVLGITTVTQTSTATSVPPISVVTTSVSSTDTITTTSTSFISQVTTVYPVVAVSTTSTCALGATVVPNSANTPKAKRWGSPPPPPPPQNNGWGGWGGWGPKPIVVAPPGFTPAPMGTPTCLTNFVGPSITSACSCLSIPTPTSLSVTTTTLPQQTVTKTIVGAPVSVTISSTITQTTFTSTYSATQYYTSTFTILPQPSQSTTYPDGAVFGNYPGLDFPGMDITNFFCYAGGPAPPAPYPSCASYADCVAECVYYNDNKLGGNTKCGTVTYNAPSDGSSGSCYLKTGQVGCGSANPNTNSSVILPLVPNDVQ